MILVALTTSALATELAPTLTTGSRWTITEETSTQVPHKGASIGSRTVTTAHVEVTEGGRIGQDTIVWAAETVGLRSEEIRSAGTVVYDSASGAKPDAEQAVYAAMVGDRWTARLEADGTATGTFDDQAFAKRLAGHGADAEMVQLLVGVMTAEGKAAEIRQQLWILPRGPLSIGQSWTSAVPGPGGETLDWVWTLRSVEGGLATFDLAVESPPSTLITGLVCAGSAQVEVQGAPRRVSVDCTGTNTVAGGVQTIHTGVVWAPRR